MNLCRLVTTMIKFIMTQNHVYCKNKKSRIYQSHIHSIQYCNIPIIRNPRDYINNNLMNIKSLHIRNNSTLAFIILEITLYTIYPISTEIRGFSLIAHHHHCNILVNPIPGQLLWLLGVIIVYVWARHTSHVFCCCCLTTSSSLPPLGTSYPRT